jgi:hypothetical protein
MEARLDVKMTASSWVKDSGNVQRTRNITPADTERLSR